MKSQGICIYILFDLRDMYDKIENSRELWEPYKGILIFELHNLLVSCFWIVLLDYGLLV